MISMFDRGWGQSSGRTWQEPDPVRKDPSVASSESSRVMKGFETEQ